MPPPRFLTGLEDDPEADGMFPEDGPALRRGIPRYLDEFGEPSADERLDAELGIDQPELDDYQLEDFQTDPVDSFLERFSAGGVPQGLQRPRGFLQGLVSGVATGAVSRGQRVGERRKKFDEAQTRRIAERDRANVQAARDYRQNRTLSKRELIKSQRDDTRRQQEYVRDNPPLTPALLEAAPWLGRSFQLGENIPKDVYQGVLKSMTPEAIADIKRKEAADSRDARRLGIQEQELTLKRTEAGKPGAGKPPTEFQGLVQMFRSRAKSAADNAAKGGLESRMIKKAWNISVDPRFQKDADTRAYWREREAFSLALNRLESGAAIAPTEFERVNQLYFVVPGDTEDDIRAKKLKREEIIETLTLLQAPSVQKDQAERGGVTTPAQLWEPE